MKTASLILTCILIACGRPAEKSKAVVFSENIMIGENKEFIVNGQPFFPIMVWAQPLENIDTCRQVGINTIVGIHEQNTNKANQYLDACRERNMWCIPNFDVSVKEHPALLGWIHRDEPDMPHKGKPKEPLDVTAERYKKIKAGDATHPVFLTLTFHFSEELSNKYKDKTFYRHYKDMTDVLGFDYYPIFGYMHTENLHLVGDGMKELRKLSDDKRPMFAWIETNGGSKWISPVNQRQVYPYEIRAEVYMAIINGAQAIGYFPHTWVAAEKLGDPKYTERGGIEGDYASFAVPPENREELKKINSQITRLTPVLCSPSVEGKVTVKSDGRIDHMVKEYNNKVYIFAVNMNRKPANAEFSVKGLSKGTRIEPDEEDRQITAAEGGFTDQFTDYAVHIYTFPGN